ncbi:replication initiation regulator SeqA [Canicola haemoglobinophilus]|uniref:Negative modulator of initiation of replication n=1 Tax=Canicola haemoglobinophilus TaxID=733 RepID=A0AB38H7P5_9PAST|nr:replication initiation negative regulator SeqA [Canicola haemoglobinophilus]STO53627.1 replication initiation regulator SeqA [Canicola haemoglobinophilus]STO68161.1 replication initiation regulator SeqA [Canicola haemoglobinophilus]
MKIIEVDEELYQYIASQTKSIGESASDILRRLLNFPYSNLSSAVQNPENLSTESVTSEPITKAQKEAPADVVKTDEVIIPVKKQSDEAIQKIVDKVRSILSSEEFQQETKAVVRFLSLLRALYRTNPESFALATESLQGRTRVYFARDEGTLLMAGNHTKPKQIPDTPFWVITNTNSGRKMLMLEGAMQSMHLPQELIEEVRPFFVTN